ncbi:MAG: hypothetical protein EPN93_12910 [Spirochaetes bacterium]|nr:MAG: hypothetical protein EPN93_12910 [Spirochaetota bacterium]
MGERARALISHDSCYFCGKDGYIFDNLALSGTGASAPVIIGYRHEGWPGIPHGAVGMIALLELADHLDGWMSRCPWKADFRFGGDPIGIGSRVTISAEIADGACRGSVHPDFCMRAYLEGKIHRSPPGEFEEAAARIDALMGRPVRSRNSFSIPFFSERIIFCEGHQPENCTRVFEIRETDTGGYLTSLFSATGGPMRCDTMNRHGDAVHPGVLAAMLDETLGWAGFMHVWQGGVTVDFSVIFAGEVRPDEHIYSVGACTGVRGPHRKKLVECEGAIIALRGGREVLIGYARGRWLTTAEFKERMLRYIDAGAEK